MTCKTLGDLLKIALIKYLGFHSDKFKTVLYLRNCKLAVALTSTPVPRLSRVRTTKA